MKKINKFWKWYDNIKEPYRFIFMFFVLALPLHLSSLTGHVYLMFLFIPMIISRIMFVLKEETNENN